jgi:hypothetical protein
MLRNFSFLAQKVQLYLLEIKGGGVTEKKEREKSHMKKTTGVKFKPHVPQPLPCRPLLPPMGVWQKCSSWGSGFLT